MDFWTAAVEQLPALAISIAAFILIFIKGMRFFSEMTTTFMRHQEERDKLFAVTLKEIGEDCHEHAAARETLVLSELEKSRSAMHEFTTSFAKHEQTMSRVAMALEQKRDAG